MSNIEEEKNMSVKMKEQLQKELDIMDKKEHSIFDYLKSSPSVLIALLSTFAAAITFVARIAVVNQMKTVLSFWKFDLSYLNYDNGKMLFSALATFIYSFLIGFVYFWYESCQRSLFPCRRFLFEQKNLLKRLEREKNTLKPDKQTILNKQIATINVIIKENKSYYWGIWVISMVITWPTIFFANFLHDSVKGTSLDWKFWVLNILVTLLQLGIIKLISVFFHKKDFSKKDIRKKYKHKAIKELLDEKNTLNKTLHPLIQLHFDGIRSFFSNSTIFLCAFCIFLNSIAVCVIPLFNTLKYTWKNEQYRIVTLDEIPYVIVLQDNNRYYLERAEIIELEENNETDNTTDKTVISNTEQKQPQEKTVLNVYLNEQRIVVLNDISYVQQRFDDIVKIESGDANK